MRGSIVNRGGRYSIVFDLGRQWNQERGEWVRNQKWETVTEPNTRKHAERLLAKRLAEVHGGEYFEPTRKTFRDFAEAWVSKYAQAEGLKPSTLSLYRGLIRNHLNPEFGSVVLHKITVEQIQDFKALKMSSGLSAQTVKHLLRLVRQMLDHAVDWGYLRKNPATKVRNPRIPKTEMDALNPSEVTQLLEAVPDTWYSFFFTAITTGLRIGELMAMRWVNLDWDLGLYNVRETWVRPREGRPASFSIPKTESSRAPVDLTPTCLEALSKRKRQQAEAKLAMGDRYGDQDLIYCTHLGTPLNDSNIVRRVFQPLLDKAGIRRIRFHDLRHTTASLLIHQGENPKYIQKQMRHASATITFDRYGHLFPEVRSKAARRLDRYIFGQAAS